jgi:hypothetical protein
MSKKPLKFGKIPKTYSEKIVKILSNNSNKPYDYKQICAILELTDTKSRNEIIKDLKILAAQKIIIESEPGQFLVKAVSQDYYEGTIDMTTRKTAYFVCEEYGEDVFIPTNNLNRALDKDKVKVYIYNRRRGKKPEGEVIEVLERKKTEFVGVIDIQKNFAFVSTANAKMYTDIFIPKDMLAFAESYLQLQDKALNTTGKLAAYQKAFIKEDIGVKEQGKRFVQHTKARLLNARSFKSAVHIIDGKVIPLNKSYSEYLKSTLLTNVKSFNVGTESAPMYATAIQPIINIKYDAIVEAPAKTEAAKVVEKVVNTPTDNEVEFDETEQYKFASTLDLDIDSFMDEELGEAMISNNIDSIQELLLTIAGLTTSQEQSVGHYITHAIAALKQEINEEGVTINKSREKIQIAVKTQVSEMLKDVHKSLLTNLAIVQAETNKTPRVLAYEKAYQTTIGNIKNIGTQFEALFDKAVTSYEKQSKTELEEEEAEQKEKNYSKDATEENSKLSVGTVLKNFLYGVQKRNSKGEIQTGYLGIPDYYTFNEIFNELTKVLSVGHDLPSDYNALITKLEKAFLTSLI